MGNEKWPTRMVLGQTIVERIRPAGARHHMAFDKTDQIVGLPHAALAPHNDVLGVGWQKLVRRVALDLPRLADPVIEIEAFIEGHVGGDEAHGAAVGGDAADAGPFAHPCLGYDSDDHFLIIRCQKEQAPQMTQV